MDSPVERERFRNLHYWRQYIVFVKYSKHCCRCYQKLQGNFNNGNLYTIASLKRPSIYSSHNSLKNNLSRS